MKSSEDTNASPVTSSTPDDSNDKNFDVNEFSEGSSSLSNHSEIESVMVLQDVTHNNRPSILSEKIKVSKNDIL